MSNKSIDSMLGKPEPRTQIQSKQIAEKNRKIKRLHEWLIYIVCNECDDSKEEEIGNYLAKEGLIFKCRSNIWHFETQDEADECDCPYCQEAKKPDDPPIEEEEPVICGRLYSPGDP